MSERDTAASRSGGRTASQTNKSRWKPAGARGTARGARDFPVEGATALKLDADQQRAGGLREGASAPRLRVAPPAPINAPRAPFIALVVGIVIAGVLGILLINTKTAENSFKLDTLEKQQTTLDARQQALKNEIDLNKMPGSLDAAAKRLGLVKADSPAFIRMPDGMIIGVMTPANGAPAVTAQDSAAQDSAAQDTATQDTATQDSADVAPAAGQ